MAQIKILQEKEEKNIKDFLEKRFGITNIQENILKERKSLFLFTGKNPKELIKNLPFERIGLPFADVIEKTEEIRLTTEGVQILKNQITKNILDINEEQLNDWLKGRDLEIKSEQKGFFVIRHKNDFFGCGKVSENKISNFTKKNMRMKKDVL